GKLVPAPLPEQRQPDGREGARPGDPAARADEGAGARHVRRVRAVAGELEREVALDAGGKISGRAVVQRPAPVVALVPADVLGHSAPPFLVAGAEEVSEHQVLGVHGGVGFELRPPVAVRVLLAREPALRAFDHQIQRRCAFPELASDHETALCGRCSNQRTAFASASRTGVCRKPSSRTERTQEANMISRAVRTPSNGMRGGRLSTFPETNASACASPSATRCGIRIRGALRPAMAASSSRNSRMVRFACPRMYRSPRCPRSKASRWPSATSSTSTTFMPVSTYAGIRPTRKSRMTAPVGVGLTSPFPTGKVGLTMTASRPRPASSRTIASASHLLFLYGPGGGPSGIDRSSGSEPLRMPPTVAMLEVYTSRAPDLRTASTTLCVPPTLTAITSAAGEVKEYSAPAWKTASHPRAAEATASASRRSPREISTSPDSARLGT